LSALDLALHDVPLGDEARIELASLRRKAALDGTCAKCGEEQCLPVCSPCARQIFNVEALKAIVEAGHLMRALQREYFKTRALGVLNASKAAEREFDRLLAALEAPPPEAPKQGGLF
jgi:hypothetical protein